MQRNCKDVRVVFVFTSSVLLPTPTKDRLAVMSTSNVVYQFTCNTCQLRYIGKASRRLEERVSEHIPKWLNGTVLKTVRSSITQHIIESGHRCNKNNCFSVLHKAQTPSLLKFFESVAIKRLKPTLNVQQEMDYHLKLPWT